MGDRSYRIDIADQSIDTRVNEFNVPTVVIEFVQIPAKYHWSSRHSTSNTQPLRIRVTALKHASAIRNTVSGLTVGSFSCALTIKQSSSSDSKSNKLKLNV